MTTSARPALTREYVREILVELVVNNQRIHHLRIDEATVINEPTVMVLAKARLVFAEAAELKDGDLQWVRGCTIGSVLDALGLKNGSELKRERGRRGKSHWSRT